MTTQRHTPNHRTIGRRLGTAAAAAVAGLLLAPAAASAAPQVPTPGGQVPTPGVQITTTMTIDGRIDSIVRHGRDCRYTGTFQATTTLDDTYLEGRIEARWTDDCPAKANTGAYLEGTIDARLLGVASTAGGTPDGFRFRGTATNVSTTASGTPDGFRFRGVFVPGRV